MARPELWAIRTDGAGDVGNSHVLWKSKQGIPAKPSVVVAGESIYLTADNGVSRCIDLRTGRTLWQERLEGQVHRLPVYAGGPTSTSPASRARRR
jgi:outer membrane protein assembly factor BamB